jgi:hypothetical protein
VPGQVISEEIMVFMQALDTREIHGYDPDFGFLVFTEAALHGGTDSESPAQEKQPVAEEQPAKAKASHKVAEQASADSDAATSASEASPSAEQVPAMSKAADKD